MAHVEQDVGERIAPVADAGGKGGVVGGKGGVEELVRGADAAHPQPERARRPVLAERAQQRRRVGRRQAEQPAAAEELQDVHELLGIRVVAGHGRAARAARAAAVGGAGGGVGLQRLQERAEAEQLRDERRDGRLARLGLGAISSATTSSARARGAARARVEPAARGIEERAELGGGGARRRRAAPTRGVRGTRGGRGAARRRRRR